MKDQFELIKLQLRKYYRGESTSKEEMELLGILRTLPDAVLQQLLASLWDEEKGEDPFYSPTESDQVFSSVMAGVRSRHHLLWPRVAAAFAFVLLGGLCFWFLNQSTNSANKQAVQLYGANKPIIEPGSDKAVFISEAGEVVDLKNLREGTPLQQAGAVLTRETDGTIVYQPSLNSNRHEAVKSWPILKTPRGGQCPFRLPDGSQVWLNAASSISFAPDFPHGSRQVKVSGEVYFEVSKDPHIPFEVLVDGARVQVLGTRFNISAYEDDGAVVTTLLEGAVKVRDEREEKQLHPGQQASIAANERIIVRNLSNPQDAIAWKTGYFQFNDSDIASIMRQVSRWYDVSVTYEGGVPSKKLTGAIPRHVDLKQLLDVLAYSRMQFSVRGREIIVKNTSR